MQENSKTNIKEGGNSISDPVHTFRMEKKYVEELREMYGVTKTAKAIRKAILVALGYENDLDSLEFLANKTKTIKTKHAAKLLRITPDGVIRKIKRGDLRAIKPGRDWEVYLEDVEKLLKPKVECNHPVKTKGRDMNK